VCSYNLDGSVIAGTGTRFSISLFICVFEPKVLLYKTNCSLMVIYRCLNLGFEIKSVPVVISFMPN
jgi:hypothetical protein